MSFGCRDRGVRDLSDMGAIEVKRLFVRICLLGFVLMLCALLVKREGVFELLSQVLVDRLAAL